MSKSFDDQRPARASRPLLAAVVLGLLVDRLLIVQSGMVGLSYWNSVWTWRLLSGAVVVGTAVVTVASLWSWGRDKRLDEVRQAIAKDLRDGKQPSPNDAVDEKQFRVLVEERKLLGLMNDSALLLEAYQEILPHLHAVPRSAKRAVNRLRLYLYVAYARKAFGGEPALTPRHLGRWIAFQEHWPEIADLMIGDPLLMSKLEAADSAERARLLELIPANLAKDFAADEEVWLFLKDRSLGNVMPRLIHLPPAAPTPASR